MPSWMQTASALNPVNWAVEAARAAALGDGGWDDVAGRSGLLVLFLALAMWFALWAFRGYQRSL